MRQRLRPILSVSLKRVAAWHAPYWPLPSPTHSRRPVTTLSKACIAPTTPVAPPRARLFLPDATHTYRLGALLGANATAGDVILLTGELGAGKTALARGFIHATRGDDRLEVISPTYLLANSYPPEREGDKAPTVVHVDLWRVEDATKRPIVEFDRVFRECVALVEWPDRLRGAVPARRLDVLLEYPDVGGEGVGPVDEDDPWGFGSGDPDDIGAARDGRYASLVTHGEDWEVRVRTIYDACAQLDSDGRMVIADGKDYARALGRS